jgi:5-methylthioribose kinase
MSPQEQFKSLYPQAIYLNYEHAHALLDLIYANGWLDPSDKILSITKPGEGNMNFVVRVKTDSTSIIVKQSRPWVEKYPQIQAPAERIFAETTFYKAMAANDFCNGFCPNMIGFDRVNFLLALEDLGEGTDCTFLYRRDASIKNVSLKSLIGFISCLHNASLGDAKTFPLNMALKKLNHTHIFHYPYLNDNGFNLDDIQPGLQAVSKKYKENTTLKDRLHYLGDIYLSIGSTLIHGDFYPGSWLSTPNGIKIIDPEFSYFGYPEFDLGVMMAHLKMAHVEDAKLNEVMRDYKFPAGFRAALFKGFCGAEILRRTIGLAQLPLDLSLQEKSDLLDFAEHSILKSGEQLEF